LNSKKLNTQYIIYLLFNLLYNLKIINEITTLNNYNEVY